MAKRDVGELVEVLACEIGERPAGAPTFADLAPYLRSIERDTLAIVVCFDDAAASAVEALVAAERRCCPGLDWEVERGPVVRLRIGASPAQLDALYQMLAPRS